MRERTVFWLLSSCFILLCIGVTIYSRFSVERETVTVSRLDIPAVTAEYLPEPAPQAELDPITAENEKININTAQKEQLITLSGIGEKTAENIITYREEYGYFEFIEEIMEVSGIGQAKFDAIKDHITV